MDLMQREGNYPVPPQAGKTLGVEFSGWIEELGPGDHGDFKVGDEVFGLAYGGAYAEYLASSTKMLIHKPEEISWTIAAGIPEACIYPHPKSINTNLSDVAHGNPSPPRARLL
jgi:NADPH:quinone reductase-like Zn-dependent oxidoreductase